MSRRKHRECLEKQFGATCVTAKPPTNPPQPQGGFARIFGETPSRSSARAAGKLVEREGLEPSTPAL